MNMNGRVVIITGGSSGIGAAAARALREQGAVVAITGRSAHTEQLAKEIGAEAFLTDFSKFADVRALAAQLLAKYPRIDVLANNAGGIMAERQITEDGHEKTLQVNHLAPFLLTLLLRERLERSGATVINTSSRAHNMGRLDFSDLENERKYNGWRAYGTAKLMNILHAAEIDRRFRGVHAASFHPGVVATGFAREGNSMAKLIYGKALAPIFMLSPEKGADTLVWLATSRPANEWQPGLFYVKRKPGTKSRQAGDDELARRLWTESELMVAEPIALRTSAAR